MFNISIQMSAVTGAVFGQLVIEIYQVRDLFETVTGSFMPVILFTEILNLYSLLGIAMGHCNK